MRWTIVVLVLAIAACGGGGGSTGGAGTVPPANTPPTVSNLSLTPTTLGFMSGGGTAAVDVQLVVADPDSDVSAIHVQLSNGTRFTIPVQMSAGVTSETLIGQLSLATDIGITLTADVWVADRAANASNRLSANLTIEGSSELSQLGLSTGDFDQIFLPGTTSYTASVTFLTSGIDVQFEREDAGASIEVNDVPLAANRSTSSVDLAPGNNTIRIDVAAATGDAPVVYSIDVTRDSVQNLAEVGYIQGRLAESDRSFGGALAVDEDLMAIGSFRDRSAAVGIDGNEFDESLSIAGAVHLYARDGAGLWSRQHYIKASNTGSDDSFGISVALDGDTLVVGADGEASAATGVNGNQQDNSAPGAGAVYVFVRSDVGIWSQQAYIKASNPGAGDRFGDSVAIDGDTLVVSATGEDSGATGVDGNQGDNGVSDAGAVYVFERNQAGNWTQQAYIKASNPDVNDAFGSSVAIVGDAIAVGASGEDSLANAINGDQTDNSGIDIDPITDTPDERGCGAGATYVFHRDANNNWTQEAYLKASDAGAGDCFGNDVSMSGNTVAVGARQQTSQQLTWHEGAAYVFVVDDSRNWTEQALIKHSRTRGQEYFGASVAIEGNTLAVGAPSECSITRGINNPWMPGLHPDWCADPSSSNGEGAAFVFVRDGADQWSQQAYIKPSDTIEDGTLSFGAALALSGDSLAVRDPGRRVVYVFR